MKNTIDTIGLTGATSDLKSFGMLAAYRHRNIERKVGVVCFYVMSMAIAIEKAHLVANPNSSRLRLELKILLIDLYRDGFAFLRLTLSDHAGKLQ